jgi:DNA topoisomerase-2
MGKKNEEKYRILDQISHVLLRPQTYVGSNKPNKSIKNTIQGGKILGEEITFIPSFIKIFDEVITNSVDEHKRNKSLNKIDVTINSDGFITILDNGGIPVEIHSEYGQYIPEVIFGNLMSGSNYDDSEGRIVAGLNGLGAKLTNIFSTKFIVSTGDGKKEFRQEYSNNMRDRESPTIKKSKKKFTEIKYKPDFSQFGNLESIDGDHFKMIEKRVWDLAGTNPSIKFTFNGLQIEIETFEDYTKLYLENNEYFFESGGDWSISISSSNRGFNQISFVNSTETYDGGTHVDYVLSQIISPLREFFQKKHKTDVKPSEIKNHITLFVNSVIINPSFSSQTKEKLITEPKDFGSTWSPSDKMIKWILKSEIVHSILDWINQKKLADESKLARDLNKNLSKIKKVEKLIDAKSVKREACSLGIFEGDSASSAFRKYRNPDTMGAFALKGKFSNVSEITHHKLTTNDEIVNLMAAIGLKLGQKAELKKLRYGKILFYCDADVDGNSIVGLLINFFNKYWPELFEMGIIYKVETPILVAKSRKKGVDKIMFYNLTEWDKWSKSKDLSKWEIKYKKGLAALVDDEYEEIINKPKLNLIKSDETSVEYLDIWFGKNSDLRKKQILD